MRGNIGALRYDEDGVYLLDERILDLNDRMHNYSRFPLQRLEEADPDTIVDTLVHNYEVSRGLFPDEYGDTIMCSLYICALLAERVIKRENIISVAEIGCNNGLLSSQLAPLLFRANSFSRYMCISNTIGNESDNLWLDAISQVEMPLGLSFLVSDFDASVLRDTSYSIVIINGSVRMSNPDRIIQEAVRIAEKDGMIILYSMGQHLLDDMFRLYFDEKKEYRLCANQVIYTADAAACHRFIGFGTN